ncbi:recombination regulator RecX [Rhizobium sp. BK661]|uniref:recombination regulator RecX n=1 Tax=unclassified Rhizobium TaxID=2613769 RepID=UPI0016104D7D|nr:recombination regulator RecX [Rhizobium sp. BK661]MBB3544847.1 regulatory protein [Rhizobium sp. BK399]MCS3743441.1 regulatory protein [Rhizobium sp. BK661]
MSNEPTPSDIPTARMLSWARNSTIYRLERQMMTERQLFDAIIRKAKQKFTDINEAQLKAIANFAVAFAYEHAGLNDTAYAEIRTRSGVRSGRSKRHIAQKLSQKGVDGEVITAALDEADDLLAAVVLARKRAFGPFRRGDGDRDRVTKEMAAFARNGFSFDIGRAVLGMSREEAEDVMIARSR